MFQGGVVRTPDESLKIKSFRPLMFQGGVVPVVV